MWRGTFESCCRYLKCDLTTFDLTELDCKFDSILLEPPIQELQRRGVAKEHYWDWEDVCKNLNLKKRKKNFFLLVIGPTQFYFLSVLLVKSCL